MQWNIVIMIGLSQHKIHGSNETFQLRPPLQRHQRSYLTFEIRNYEISLYYLTRVHFKGTDQIFILFLPYSTRVSDWRHTILIISSYGWVFSHLRRSAVVLARMACVCVWVSVGWLVEVKWSEWGRDKAQSVSQSSSHVQKAASHPISINATMDWLSL